MPLLARLQIQQPRATRPLVLESIPTASGSALFAESETFGAVPSIGGVTATFSGSETLTAITGAATGAGSLNGSETFAATVPSIGGVTALLSGSETFTAAGIIGATAAFAGSEAFMAGLPSLGGISALFAGAETLAAGLPSIASGATFSGTFVLFASGSSLSSLGGPSFSIGALWSDGYHDGRVISAISVEHRLVPVTATYHGVTYDPSGDSILVAVTPSGIAPTTWVATTWENWVAPWGTAHFAVVPLGSTFPVTKGMWDVWIQIPDAAEVAEILCPTPLVVM